MKTFVMNYRHLFIFLIGLAFMISFFSCKKDSVSPMTSFYGQWKTSYDDTVIFAKENGKNVVYSLHYFTPGPGAAREFSYFAGRFKLKYDALPSSRFYTLSSFTWIEPGSKFSVQNTEWFPFAPFMLTYTFTKIQ